MARDLEAPPDEQAPTPKGGRDLEPPEGSPQRAKPAVTPSATLGPVSTGALHTARHMVFGLGDKLAALESAIAEAAQDKSTKPEDRQNIFFGPNSRYDRNLAFNDALLEASDKVNPAARWVGNGLGAAVSTAGLAAAPAIRAAVSGAEAIPAAVQGGNLLSRAISAGGQGAKLGTILGALSGYGTDRSDNLRDTAINAGLSGLAGAIVGAPLSAGLSAASEFVTPRLAAGARSLYSLLKGAPGTSASPAVAVPGAAPAVASAAPPMPPVSGVPLMAKGLQPIPEAQRLQALGVPLTLRQMAPNGLAAEVSEAALRVPVLGKQIAAQDAAAQNAWRNIVLDQARPPLAGATPNPLKPADTMSRLQSLKGDFKTAYDSIADRPAVIGATHPDTGEVVNPHQAFAAILGDPDYQASDTDLGIVKKVMDNQLGKLDRLTEANRLNQTPSIKAGTLMNMRSDLREAAQKASLAGESSRAQMLQDAADSVTGGLNASLHPEDAQFLKDTDAAYSRYMRVMQAAMGAGRKIEEGEFGPKQLKGALLKQLGRKFVEDPEAGGNLRDLARAGDVVFTPRDPMTGHGEMLKSALGLGLGPAVYQANASPAAQSAFTQLAQRAIAEGALGRQSNANTLGAMLTRYGAFPAVGGGGGEGQAVVDAIRERLGGQ